MRRVGLAFLCLLTLPLYAEDAGIDIRGSAVKVVAANDAARKAGALGTLAVEGKVEKGSGYDKATVTVFKTTKIVKLEGKVEKPAKFDDLKVGTKLEIKFHGPVAESYPVQAGAGKIVILPE